MAWRCLKPSVCVVVVIGKIKVERKAERKAEPVKSLHQDWAATVVAWVACMRGLGREGLFKVRAAACGAVSGLH